MEAELDARLEAALERYDARMQAWLEKFAVSIHEELKRIESKTDATLAAVSTQPSKLKAVGGK